MTYGVPPQVIKLFPINSTPRPKMGCLKVTLGKTLGFDCDSDCFDCDSDLGGDAGVKYSFEVKNEAF